MSGTVCVCFRSASWLVWEPGRVTKEMDCCVSVSRLTVGLISAAGGGGVLGA